MTLIGVVPNPDDRRRLIINQDYIEAVLRAGGTPVLFPMAADRAAWSRLMEEVDGLLLTGGDDVEPSVYGEEKRPCCGTCTPERDRMEIALCREAVDRNLPLLAICRGIQVLSCALGGTLYQDIAEDYGRELRHPCYETPADPVHEVTVEDGTLLSGIVGPGVLRVNSRHHQALRRPGEGLKVCASSPDGLTEAVEMPSRGFVLGVQWHPESMSSRYPVHQKLFDAFVAAAGSEKR